MTDPEIFDKKPIRMDLKPGRYNWCSCGKSKNQPLCDRSHAGTGISPIPFEVTEPGEKAYCQCKHTKNKPFCDGSHGKL